jgi:hypothetical protein
VKSAILSFFSVIPVPGLYGRKEGGRQAVFGEP